MPSNVFMFQLLNLFVINQYNSCFKSVFRRGFMMYLMLKINTNNMNNVEINEGEIVLKLNNYHKGKISFSDLELHDEDLILSGGLLRLKVELSDLDQAHFYKVPTIELAYYDVMGEIHWQCDYNGETILDKNDHHGKSTVLLLNRKKLDELEHRHENELIIHAEFPAPVSLDASNSYIHIF